MIKQEKHNKQETVQARAQKNTGLIKTTTEQHEAPGLKAKSNVRAGQGGNLNPFF